jgi:hypothetical protein
MQLTTILAVLFSSLLVFALVGYTDSSNVIRDRHPLSYSNPQVKSRAKFDPRHERLFNNGHRQFAGRAILESIKQRRKH